MTAKPDLQSGTDVTAALRQAVEDAQYGSTINFGPGRYLLSDTIPITKPLILQGKGKATTLILCGRCQNYLDIMAKYVKVANLTFDGAGLPTDQPSGQKRAVFLKTTEHASVWDCYFENLNWSGPTAADRFHAVMVAACNHLEVARSTFTRVSGSAVHMRNASQIELRHNRCRDVRFYPLHFQADCRNAVVAGNLFEGDIPVDKGGLIDSFGHGECRNIVVEKNTIRARAGYAAAIRLLGWENAVIRNNNLRGHIGCERAILVETRMEPSGPMSLAPRGIKVENNFIHLQEPIGIAISIGNRDEAQEAGDWSVVGNTVVATGGSPGVGVKYSGRGNGGCIVGNRFLGDPPKRLVVVKETVTHVYIGPNEGVD